MTVLKTIIALGAGLACLTRVSCPAAEPDPAPDLAWFTNGDRLRGQVQALDAAKGVTWRHPDVKEQIYFALDSVTRIQLGDRPLAPLKPANPIRVRLVNQDEFEGNLISLSADTLTLDTAFAGPIAIPRHRLDSLTPIVPNPSVIYEGPAGLEGWTMGSSPIPGTISNGWKYSQGAFITGNSSSIARDLKLPDMANLEFDLAWNNYLSIAIALYANSLQPIQLAAKDTAPDFGGFYSLQINFNTANIMVVKKGAPLSSLGLSFLPSMERKTSAHVMIRTHKADRMVYLYIDGQMVKQWQDPGEFSGSGTCVRFVNQVASPMKISNVLVSQWDGRLETPTNKVDNATNDFVRLLNQDVVSGSIQSFGPGGLRVQSAFGSLDIPLTRVAQVHTAQNRRQALPPKPSEMKAHFSKRGQLTLVLERWENGRMTATSPGFGSASISLAAFRLLEFPTVPRSAAIQ